MTSSKELWVRRVPQVTKQLCRFLGLGPLLGFKQAGTNLGRSVITVPGQVYWVRAPGYRRKTGREEAAF